MLDPAADLDVPGTSKSMELTLLAGALSRESLVARVITALTGVRNPPRGVPQVSVCLVPRLGHLWMADSVKECCILAFVPYIL